MRLINRFDYNYDFLSEKKRRIALAVSIVIIVGSLLTIAIRGLNLGLDFTGGTLIEVGYQESMELSTARDNLHNNGFPDAVVQYFGTTRDVLIRLGVHSDLDNKNLSETVLNLLKKDNASVEIRRVEFVGPQVGGELIEAGLLSILITMLCMLVYVALRFEWRFAVGAVLSLLHDPVLIFGIFALFQLEFDLTVLAAVLAVVGYSINDTIVVFDRIRDNFIKLRKVSSEEVMNISVNQTLSRTIMTSTTTLIVVVILFFFGGSLIHNFALALIIGIMIGTYSSIYIASAITLLLGISKADLMPVKKEGEELDKLP
ncbi:protein translocase subunit SecF [Beggiatoa leptomitoformis]|uniref:Protein-export membrane protein SecF n=1 Tax=Beggiatoa leptomitoformis TaxID=288004 RepID=A0A2N9YGF1_9GAMM|nr:protein translocase subunit SecF [Beggiatoa leptomitoformis]ALG68105.1 protein translocase subunit SecF [Beggiatoa leptomitoformis]AUI69598.1 protein translocase subunit SecF [Beggiatoa leptomitoformis]